MFEYKDINFYTEYLTGLEDFTVIEELTLEKNDYVGKIMPNNSIYPIEITVSIPQTFPHNKLVFSTTSISGYPHLIKYRHKDESKGSWFCLNTAFAETAIDQLDEEFMRLRGWLKKQLRPNLPKHITDNKTIYALRHFNVYEGANPDEVNEVSESNNFQFFGNFGENPEKFDKSGKLNVVVHPNQYFTVVESANNATDKLPYIIVDYLPDGLYNISSWVDEFGWSDSLVESLLPGFDYHECIECRMTPKRGKEKRIHTYYYFDSDEEATKEQEIMKSNFYSYNVPSKHKSYLQKSIDNLVREDRSNREQWNQMSIFDEDPYYAPEYEYSHYINQLHYFAIGVKQDATITWYLVSTNIYGRETETFEYDLEDCTFSLEEIVDIKLYSFSKASIIKREDFFGRAELSANLCDKKVAVIGLGAIGSSVAESLVRGGLYKISLFDGDLVEPGNICRSTYEARNIGNSKGRAIEERIRSISPFCDVTVQGSWFDPSDKYYGVCYYYNGDFYGNINYSSQEKFIKKIQDYDIIIDCTASNELLHFLSYAVKDTLLLSLCITNKSRDLLCVSNKTGNVFELRKHYLSCIEQETGNFYSEGTGCKLPTFLAANCDIQALSNLCVRTINRQLEAQETVDSWVFSYDDNSITSHCIGCQKIENGEIRLIIKDDCKKMIMQLPMMQDGFLGYLLGGYDRDRTSVYITGITSANYADKSIKDAKNISNGIISWVGLIYVGADDDISPYAAKDVKIIVDNAKCPIKNPIIASVKREGHVKYYIYIGGEFIPFEENL